MAFWKLFQRDQSGRNRDADHLPDPPSRPDSLDKSAGLSDEVQVRAWLPNGVSFFPPSLHSGLSHTETN